MKDVDKYSFLSHIFKYLEDGEVPIVASPDFKWKALAPTSRAFRQDVTPRAWYFSIAAHRLDEHGKLRRSNSLFSTAHCLVLDDIGTKVRREPPSAPSWILETSKGNYQWGWIIHPYPYRERFEYSIRLLATRGWTDGGSVDAVHLFRVPGSLHSSGFMSKLEFWEPRRRNHLPAVLRDFGIEDIPEVPEVPHQFRGRKVSPAAVQSDPYFKWLTEGGMVRGGMNAQGWVPIICPWAHRHTDSGREGFDEARYKPGAKAFVCFHESCASQDSMSFFRWVMDERLKDV